MFAHAKHLNLVSSLAAMYRPSKVLWSLPQLRQSNAADTFISTLEVAVRGHVKYQIPRQLDSPTSTVSHVLLWP